MVTATLFCEANYAFDVMVPASFLWERHPASTWLFARRGWKPLPRFTGYPTLPQARWALKAQEIFRVYRLVQQDLFRYKNFLP